MSSTHKTSVRRRCAAMFLASALAGGALAAGSLTTASAQPAPPEPSGHLRTVIVGTAKIELKESPRNRAITSTSNPNMDCNWYSGYWKTSGDDICSKRSGGVKYRSNNWCADFVRYVWSVSGTRTKGFDPFAGSFYRASKTYGTGTYHSKASGYTPKPGDAVLYDWDGKPDLGTNGWGVDHVGIVIAYKKGAKYPLTTIEGNTAPDGKKGPIGTFERHRVTSQVVGYVAPKKK